MMTLLRVLLAMALLAGTGWAANSPQEEELLMLIRAQAAAFEKTDVTAIMATIHRDSPLREATRNLVEKIKETYGLRFTVEGLAVESITEDEAHVSFTQTTEKLRGPQFRNNRVQGIHIFKKEDGKWKFFDCVVEKVDYLDKAGAVQVAGGP